MGRRRPRNIKIREDRLDKLDSTKMEVAIWLLAKGMVEDRTQRSRSAPPSKAGHQPPTTDVNSGEHPKRRKAT